MKKTIKLKSLELFKEFAEKNNYGVYNDSFMSTSYTIRTPKEGEKRSEFYFEDFLDSSLDKVRNDKKFFEFLSFVLQKNELDVAVAQCIKKTPSVKNFDYSGSVRSILSAITPYKKAFFEYVARPKFLEHSSDTLDYILTNIQDQEHRTAIFEAMFQTKIFQDINIQKDIYLQFSKSIRDKSKLEKFFNKIEKIEDNTTLIDFSKITSVVIVGFSTVKLANANLESKTSGSNLAKFIKSMAEDIMRKNEELEISNVITSPKDTENYVFNIFCPPEKSEFNSIVFEEMVNRIARLPDAAAMLDFKDNFNSFVKEIKATTLADSLTDQLNDKTDIKRSKLKI